MKSMLRHSLRGMAQAQAIRASCLPLRSPVLSSAPAAVISRGFSLGKGYDVLGDVDEDNPLTNINGYGSKSFSVTNVYVTHSVGLFPRSFLLWNVRKPDDITMESLEIFANYYPTIEILFIGTGRKRHSIPEEIHKRFRTLGIMLDVTDTPTAAATFNLLNSEGRNVCAALLTMDPMEDDDFQMLIDDDLEILEARTGKKF